MSVKRMAARLDTLSTRLFQEAIRLEKLHDQVDDLTADCDSLDPEKGMDYAAGVAAIAEAVKRLRAISWTIAQADSSLQEAAWAAQEAHDDLDGLSPP